MQKISKELNKSKSSSRVQGLLKKFLTIPCAEVNGMIQNLSPNLKEVLEQKIRQIHKVEQYCELLNVSRHQLNKMTKAHFGKTSKQMVQNRLLQEIKVELQYTDKTVNEIAHDLGFSEANNLTRFFKNATGMSPKEFYKCYQKDRN